MADYTKIAFSDIRAYLWQKLQDEGILDPNDYWIDKMQAKVNPIIPSQQIPEMHNLLPGVPYIIYDIESVEYTEDFWICEEVAVLTVVGDSYTKIYSIIELIKDLLRRYDISGRDINNFNPNSPFIFLKSYISSIISPNIGAEGDNQTAEIEITYCYTRPIDESSYRYQ
jgi:hypothetical protein